MNIDTSKPIQFTVSGDTTVFTWNHEHGFATWTDKRGTWSRKYNRADVVNNIAEGYWKIIPDDSWYDRKEFPPVGATVRLNPGYKVQVVGQAINGNLLVETVEGNRIIRVYDPTHLKPLAPTEHELEVEAVAADLMVTPAVAESIILKGYKKQ